MPYDDQKSFLEELQSLSEKSKRRVLIIGTVVIMAIVVGMWVVYFNNVIAQSSQQSVADGASAGTPGGTVPVSTSTPSTPSISGLWQNVENDLASIGSIFKRPSNYMIQPQSN